MKNPKLPPRPVHFEGLVNNPSSQLNMRWVRVIEYRPPRKGEYYLSGAIVEAFKAKNNLTSSYWIVEPLDIDPMPTDLHQYQ